MTKTVLVIALVLLLAATHGKAACPRQHYAPAGDLPAEHDSTKCKLKVERCSKVLLASQCGSGSYTHVFSDANYFGFKCQESGNACETNHLPFLSDALTFRVCAPKTSSTVVVAVTHSVDSCTDIINVRYENITACTCQSAGTGTA